MSVPNVRVLLLQARDDTDPMREHEHECFVRVTGLPLENIVCHDLRQGPPTPVEQGRFDALMVGGSGDYYVSRGNLPHFDRTLEFLREVVERGHPMYASCFGYQSLVRALGGEVIHDPDNTEVGTYDLALSDDGAKDELFSLLPMNFKAQMGHKDRAEKSPTDLPNLAGSKLSPLQALRIPHKPIWASQFHPELERETNLDRFRHYLDGYAKYMSDDERQEAIDGFQESEHTPRLLTRFLTLVFG